MLQPFLTSRASKSHQHQCSQQSSSPSQHNSQCGLGSMRAACTQWGDGGSTRGGWEAGGVGWRQHPVDDKDHGLCGGKSEESEELGKIVYLCM